MTYTNPYSRHDTKSTLGHDHFFHARLQESNDYSFSAHQRRRILCFDKTSTTGKTAFEVSSNFSPVLWKPIEPVPVHTRPSPKSYCFLLRVEDARGRQGFQILHVESRSARCMADHFSPDFVRVATNEPTISTVSSVDATRFQLCGLPCVSSLSETAISPIP